MAALRGILGREASGDWERETPSGTGAFENLPKSTESGLHSHDVPISVVVMKLLDSLTLERFTGDKTPVPDGKDVRFTLTGADVKFLEQAARSKGTSRNELVRAIVRKMREDVGETIAA